MLMFIRSTLYSDSDFVHVYHMPMHNYCSSLQRTASTSTILFPKVTTADIEAFEVKYKCSDEEEADVLKILFSIQGRFEQNAGMCHAQLGC